jgi:GntR family transcriptional regulator, transcriptional repressor for pyruvate dehydrogenase complex
LSVEFKQIRIEKAYRKVASALIERIVDRTLRDGDHLPPETELARQFGVNRSTVREALRELESNGLLERRRGSKRMVVTRPQTGMVGEGVSRALVLHDVTSFDVWEALTILEPPIAEVAARRRLESDLPPLHAAAERFVADNANTARAVHHVAEFFGLIGEATHNPALALAQEPLMQLFEPSLGVMIDKIPQARSRIVSAQRRLYEALKERDVEGARNWMAKHIRDFKRGYELAGIDLRHHVVQPFPAT